MNVFQLKKRTWWSKQSAALEHLGCWFVGTGPKTGSIAGGCPKGQVPTVFGSTQVELLWTSMHQHTMNAGKLLQNSFLLGSNSLANHGGLLDWFTSRLLVDRYPSKN